MDKDTFAELFSLRVRGALAASFSYSERVPSDVYWSFLRGEKEITLRDISDIGYVTGTRFDMSLSPLSREEAQTDDA